MDYLEGLCLGRLWSDTDFENRRHLSLFLLYGVFVDLLVVYNYLTGGMNGLITGAFLQKVIIFVVLFFFLSMLAFATVLGVISGGVYIVVVVLLILLAALLIPGIVFCVARFLQYWYDKVVSMLVLADYTEK